MKKVFAILLVCMTALAIFTGCQRKNEYSGPVDLGATTEGPNYWWVKFDEPVTIRVVNAERPGTPFMPGDDVTSNQWTRSFK